MTQINQNQKRKSLILADSLKNRLHFYQQFSQETDHNAKINETERKVTNHNHDQYITPPKFNKFTAEIFSPRIAQANLITKTDFDNTLISLHRKISANKTRHVLVKKELENYKRLI